MFSADNRLDDVERHVLDRYTSGARAVEPALCCPIDGYDRALLKRLPAEIIEKDYGCGDPSRWVRQGETVVDLGSGAGKICYILAQKIGADGRVVGLDMNDSMLTLARKYQDEMARKLGYGNTRFHKARIQDMALDLERAEEWLRSHPLTSLEQVAQFEAECDRLRSVEPLLADQSVDVVVSNCVLNLVRPQDKGKLFTEIHRVLRPGGRAVISDIVCDEEPTPFIMADPKLWSGCISGALQEDRCLKSFEEAGFYGVEVLARSPEAWQVIDGVEFRSLTVRAYKGKEGPCLEHNQAVIYKGPWKLVRDDDGHVLQRGQRMAVCDKTFHILTDPAGPYAAQVNPVPPRVDVPLQDAKPFDCHGSIVRHPGQTKGLDYHETRTSDGKTACTPGRGCC